MKVTKKHETAAVVFIFLSHELHMQQSSYEALREIVQEVEQEGRMQVEAGSGSRQGAPAKDCSVCFLSAFL